MGTTRLAGVSAQLGELVERVLRTRERVTIGRHGRPAAVLISAEELEALDETLHWAGQDHVDERGPTVGIDEVMSAVRARLARDRG